MAEWRRSGYGIKGGQKSAFGSERKLTENHGAGPERFFMRLDAGKSVKQAHAYYDALWCDELR